MVSSASLGVYVVTFNCGRLPANPVALSRGLFHSYHEGNAILPDLVVVSLQEVAPLSYSFLHSFLGFDWLSSYYDEIVLAVNQAAGADHEYLTLATGNVGMTAMLVLAKPEFVEQVRSIEMAGVGVGLLAMGNKGAIGIRLQLGTDQPQLTFVAAHLAPMEDAVERRNADWKEIVRGLVFRPSSRTRSKPDGPSQESEPLLAAQKEAKSGMFSNQSLLFFAGDLNYRSSDTSPTPADLARFPKQVQDVQYEQHYSHLLEKDQLRREMKAGRTAQSLSELPVDFPPTYKYSSKAQKSALTQKDPDWNWAIHRMPSWCDRVLFSDILRSSKAMKPLSYDALPIQPTSDHRPVALALQLDMSSIERLDAIKSPYAIDPDAEQKRAAARRLEIVVGITAYLGYTWEGNGLLLATVAGAIGVWYLTAAFTPH